MDGLYDFLIKYNGVGVVSGIYIAAVIYIFLKGGEKEKLVFAYYSFFFALVVFNPVVVMFLRDHVSEVYDTYWRMMWALPVVPLIAYVFAKAFQDETGKRKRAALCAVLVAAIAISGQFVFADGNFTRAENKYKVPDTTVQLSAMLKEIDETPLAIVPYDVALTIRQYDANVTLVVGRYIAHQWAQGTPYDQMGSSGLLYEQLYAGVPMDRGAFLAYMADCGNPLVVVEDSALDTIEFLAETGLLLAGHVPGYSIYQYGAV